MELKVLCLAVGTRRGVTANQVKLEGVSGKNTIGGVYNVLENLTRKKLLRSKFAPSKPGSRGRSIKFYTATKEGRKLAKDISSELACLIVGMKV
jgi:DNA-binding PadR family transcriptional regulator